MTEISSSTAAEAAATPEPRPGVPVWRVGKPDAALAADVDTARAAVLTIASDSAIGKHLGARSEGVRCVTHLFESKQPGYSGWVWFASLSRVARGKYSTVNEVGMLPTEDSVLAPAWVPWAERVRPEDQQEEQAAEEAAAHDGADDAGADAAEAENAGEAGPEEDAAAGPDADGGDFEAESSDV
ncbi:DUF3027 domain-containing protein [Arthrobacter sp. HY1533]|uniref:DUF3027 domain-containing protein n=1 Tax=Arthrobacter sp. HY1533 TaxID=2970919 RepID=UPI0022B9F04F|nr:DUF3027 domain-containing protein [Arthrobacter sp. HY1533]